METYEDESEESSMPIHSGWGACDGESGGFDGVYEITLLRKNECGPPTRNKFVFEIAGDTVEVKSPECEIGITWPNATTCYLQTPSLVRFDDARVGLGVLLTPPGESFSVRQHFIVVKREEEEAIVVKSDTSGEELRIAKDWWLQGAFPETQLQKQDFTGLAVRNPLVVGRYIDGHCYMSNPNPFVNGDTCSHSHHVQLRFGIAGNIEAYVRQNLAYGAPDFCCPRKARYIGPPTSTKVVTLEAFRDGEKLVVRCVNLAGSLVATIPIDEPRSTLAEFRATLAKQLENPPGSLRILLPDGLLMDNDDELMCKLLPLATS